MYQYAQDVAEVDEPKTKKTKRKKMCVESLAAEVDEPKVHVELKVKKNVSKKRVLMKKKKKKKKKVLEQSLLPGNPPKQDLRALNNCPSPFQIPNHIIWGNMWDFINKLQF